ncbi:NB-ARC domain-containing protein, partial [Candidatus Finniella inopinata]
MKNSFQFPQEIYNRCLKEVAGIQFSSREIDVIAYILLGEETKQIPYNMPIAEEVVNGKTAFTYKISDSTVESHIENIYEKLSPFAERYKDDLKNITRKRDKIKFLVDRSGKKPTFESYCHALKAENLFLNHLEKIFQKLSSLINLKQTITCQINYWDPSPFNLTPIAYTYLARHLNDRQKKNGHKIMTTTLKGGGWDSAEAKTNYSFYILPAEVATSLSTQDSHIHQAFAQLEKEAAEKNQHLIFLLHNWKEKKPVPKEIRHFQWSHFNEPENYFLSVFQILKRMFPHISIENEIVAFKIEYEKLRPKEEVPSQKKKVITVGLITFGVAFLAIFICIVMGLLPFQKRSTQADNKSIHSDLVLPVETAFLERLGILAQIEKKLDGKDDIQTVVLVGAGGSGKTTLARHFGRRCKASIVWEINAETKVSLMNSFRDLAHNLIQTDEHRKKLDLIQNTRNLEEQEKQLLSFVKQGLKEQSNWLLIYDNVESIEDVKPYLPQNQSVWGRGKIILTTRDANIKDTSFIQPQNVIEIDELNQNEALALFTKILHNGHTDPSEDVIGFLQKIASFPLDVSLAGYYIKNTYITYKDYLDLLNQHSSDFEELQTGLLKKSGHYGQTRDRIITISLQKIMEDHRQEFKELLLFISLLDSQNIPLELLSTYKEKILVHNFIHLLKEYSLVITPEESGPANFSLHRNIQSTMLSHLTQLLNLEKDKHLIEQIGLVFRQYIAKVIDECVFRRIRTAILVLSEWPFRFNSNGE